MKKIAFFVEGQTEQIFVNKLVKEMLGYGNATIIQKKISGGTNVAKHELMKSYTISSKSDYQVLIYDCGADNRVKSEILDNMESLYNSGYTHIIGLRDLYPLLNDEYNRLKKGLNFLPYDLRKYKDFFEIIVVIQEVETWFLGEASHFMKMDKRLSGNFIKKKLGFDPNKTDPLTREHPSEDLDNIYKLVRKSYTKKYWQVEKLVNKLDFNKIRHSIRYKIPSLDEFITEIELFKKSKLLNNEETRDK